MHAALLSPAKKLVNLLTVKQVAERYGVCVETVRRWIRKGVIAHVRVGPYRMVRITEEEADRHFKVMPGAKS